MKLLTKIVALVLLALWLPATVHCQLENIPALDFLSCCDHPDQAPHQDNDCDNDGCAVVEGGGVMAALGERVAPMPIVWQFSFYSIPEVIVSIAPVLSLAQVNSSPPELAHAWQFISRAAAEVRAPSFVS